MATLPAQPIPSAGPGAPAPVVTAHALDYIGQTGTLFGIFFKNLFLTILTLGIYRFWAKTRERRFLWANTQIDDEGFEYTGTGKELFLGFLKAVAVLVPLFVGLQLVELFVLDENFVGIAVLGAVRLVLILGLVYAGAFAAHKYRMSRTTWRGIRFQQDGSMWCYAGMALLGLLLTPLTLGLYLPFLQTRLMRYETGNLRFGTAHFRFTGEGKTLFKLFLRVWLTFIVLVLVVAFGILGIGMSQMQMQKETAVVLGSLIPLLIIVILAPLSLWYQARAAHFRAENTSLEGLAFAMPRLTGYRLFNLLVGNYFIIVLSVGLLTPLATQRTMRFWIWHTRLNGTVDVERIAQAARGPGTGEGLAGFFDVDMG